MATYLEHSSTNRITVLLHPLGIGGSEWHVGIFYTVQFPHWLQQSLIYGQAEQHKGSELCSGIQIIPGSQYLRRAKRLFVETLSEEPNIIMKRLSLGSTGCH